MTKKLTSKLTIFIPDKGIGIHGIAKFLSDNYTIEGHPSQGRWVADDGTVYHNRVYRCVIYTDNPDQILAKIPEIRDRLKEQCVAVEVQTVEFKLI